MVICSCCGHDRKDEKQQTSGGIQSCRQSFESFVEPDTDGALLFKLSGPRTQTIIKTTLASWPHKDFSNTFVGPDQQMVTKRPSNWSPGPILGAFCTIFRARPVGTGARGQVRPETGQKQDQKCNFNYLFYVAGFWVVFYI